MNKKHRRFNFKITNGMKVGIRIMLTLVVVFFLFIMAAERLNIATVTDITDSLRSFMSGLNPGPGYPYNLNSGSVKEITVLNGDLFVLTDQDTFTLDSTAKLIKTTSHTYSSPKMSSRGSKVILYNRNGNRFRVENRTDTLFSGETKDDEKIITAAMGAKGNIAIATFSDDCASKLKVYSNNYKNEIFSWSCAQDMITSLDLADNGRYAAVSVVGARDGEIYSKVIVFDFNYSEPKAEFEYPGTAALAVHFSKNDNIVMIGDNLTSFIKGLKNKTELEYGSSTLQNFTFSEDGYTAIALAQHGSTNDVKILCYSSGLSQTFDRDFDKSVKSLYMSNGRISAVFDDQVCVIRSGGSIQKKYDADSSAIMAFNLGNRTYLYSVGEIKKCK
ncbi:MAG: DUF5711 family protein [Clostridia bacterium]|nr:DUF5711 family protein [Clostridia bacterium]